ncbi:DUF484 family protein [Shewanella intestini]|uniref:DUF484 family protein n=1 Tax=Shewanella intestini TaxID=2017544 RepID=A0ABS5I8G3_9GAMM|nr:MULTISPECIES: DUF484 family protein [Shewanella]MBR9729610.1 DUF484 family protein [Shewanella intestini]MRG37662.1 DUF484 family protein [Shewanella sp. XMDDZSB0408]
MSSDNNNNNSPRSGIIDAPAADINSLGTNLSFKVDDIDQPFDELLLREYLLDNPDFFNRYPELLLAMRVPHHERGAVSLVERRQQMLSQRVAQLEEEITSLMNIATRNEAIFEFNTQLCFDLLACEDLGQLRQVLAGSLKAEFGFSHVRLITVHDVDSELANIWRNRIRDDYYFGRITQLEAKRLFGGEVGSVALTRLSMSHSQVIFGIASTDPAHFRPEMDSLLFSQIRRMLDHMLPKL